MEGILIAVNMLLELSLAIQKTATLVQKAQAEGRDITEEELASINASLDKSFTRLNSVIESKEE